MLRTALVITVILGADKLAVIEGAQAVIIIRSSLCVLRLRLRPDLRLLLQCQRGRSGERFGVTRLLHCRFGC